MRKVRRDEIVDYVTYEETRAAFKQAVLAEKAQRRIHLGEHITLLFETTETVRYQIQEMVRIERIVREADIQHEIDTYNGILGEQGELGCTLLIEIDDKAKRDQLLREWLTLPGHVFAELEDGTRIQAVFDKAQVGEDRVSSVQFLRFGMQGRPPTAFGIDHPSLHLRAALTDEQKVALAEDLSR